MQDGKVTITEKQIALARPPAACRLPGFVDGVGRDDADSLPPWSVRLPCWS
jgi:hypothetical protein